MEALENTLKSHGLRKTKFRIELLKLFNTSKSSLNVEEIKSKIGDLGDKVTIYRALESFEKAGIIHKVPDRNNVTRFAICDDACPSTSHLHNHAHFICEVCDETFCIEEVEIPVIKRAKGFSINKLSLTLEGKCPQCQ